MTLIERLKQWWDQIAGDRDIIVMILVGLLAIGGIDMLSSQKMQRERQYHQTLFGQQMQAQMQTVMEEHVNALMALNLVYQNFIDINHYDFQQYGRSLTNNLRGFRRIMFLDPSESLRRVYPWTGEDIRLLGSHPVAPSLLLKARTTRKTATSDLVSFMGHNDSLIAVTPIFRGNNDFVGYAVGEVAVSDIWIPIHQSEEGSRYRIQIVDSAGRSLIPQTGMGNGDHITTQLPFSVADRTWTMRLQSTQSLLEMLFFQHLIIWGTGFLILTLLAILMMRSKRYKVTLSEAQQRFETVYEASPDGIVMLDDQLHFRLTNPPIQAWSGLSEEQLPKKGFFDLFTCDCPHLAKCRELSFLLCTSDEFTEPLPDTLETLITHPTTGTTRTLRLNASKVEPEAKKGSGVRRATGFICVLGDISTSKELDRVKEGYIATLTHDLKTPLLAQEMVLETILSGNAGQITPQQQSLLAGASASVGDLLDMVNSTLLYYKLESSHLQLYRQPVSLPSLVKDVADTLKPLADKRKLTFELESAMDLPSPSVDPIQMKRVFHNILSNALSYGTRDSIVRVNLSPDGPDRVLAVIRNSGKGIAEEELPHIFDKYYSLSRKFKQIGTGLGLYIARRIVELHGGRIWAESEPNLETRFYISLPAPQQI